MKDLDENIDILGSKNQLKLYGHDENFNKFVTLHSKNGLPNTILLSGPKGVGKSTFIYHFINFLLSANEENKYEVNNHKIDESNNSHKLVCNNIHPNVFILENESSVETIKVDKVRSLLNFLSKTSYNSNLKIVLIDNSEFLNINSSNALLKALEEPSPNTFFFLVHDSSRKILDTIKSRCVHFKFFLTIEKKKEILSKLIKDNYANFNISEAEELLYFESPGNILKYLSLFSNTKENFLNDNFFAITYLIDKYKKDKNPQVLDFITSTIELFYNRLSINNSNNLNMYFYNKSKIVNSINRLKKFNLDKNNFFITLLGILQNEK